MRRAAKTDANQTAIVRALRQAGCSVQSLAAVGAGCPDLLVARNGQTVLLEIKIAKGKLNTAQVEWHASWKGRVATVRTIEEALTALEPR